MCGILGTVNFKELRRNDFFPYLVHRGPDSNSSYRNEKNIIELHHFRLSIIDITNNASQPMIDNTENFILVFNGEIYNYKEIKSQLQCKGYKFKSNSDTEVVLNSYIEWGEHCLKKFRGMFSFCIYDVKENYLFLARDRFGIKPLLYYLKGNQFIFSSELKPIINICRSNLNINKDAIADIYYGGNVCGVKTIINEIKSLDAGHWMKVKFDGTIKHENYYNLSEESSKNKKYKSYNEAVLALREELEITAKYHLVSDVKVGSFLSGGVDSTIVTALMQKFSTEPINTYTIGFEKNKEVFDESNLAQNNANFLGTNHTSLYFEKNYIDKIFDNFIYYLDQPSIDGLNSYLVSKKASKEIKVAVSGLGGDEIFAGYSHFHKIYEIQKKDPNALYSFLAQLNQLRPNRYTALFELIGKSPEEAVRIIRRLNLPKEILLSSYNYDKVSKISNLSTLKRVSKFELDNYLKDTLLRDSDVTCMGNSLELRPMLLDHKLVELVFSLPDEYIMKNNGLKQIFVDSVRDLIPKNLGNISKKGFELPLSFWMNSCLNERFNDLLSLEVCNQIYRKDFLRHIRSRARNKELIWKDWMTLIFLSWINQSKVSL